MQNGKVRVNDVCEVRRSWRGRVRGRDRWADTAAATAGTAATAATAAVTAAAAAQGQLGLRQGRGLHVGHHRIFPQEHVY